MFPHNNIHKFALTYPIERTQNQTDHILIDKTWHSSMLVVRSFRGVGFDPDHCLVVATVRQRLAVSKQSTNSIKRISI
jgi:hypothetical protein